MEKKERRTSKVKCSLKPAPTLHPLQKLAHTDNNTSSPRNTILPPKQEQRNALVTAEILGHHVDLLVDSGASISIIDAGFVQEVLSEETTPIMAPSTYSRVDTVSGEKLPTVGEIELALSFSGRNFPCQFHVVENMTTNAVLGRDFLSTNDAIINFADGTLKLTNSHSVELPLTASHSTPTANLMKVEEKQNQIAHSQTDGKPAPIFPTYVCFSNRFIQQCGQTASIFLKFLIILLLMSPLGSTATELPNQPRLAPEIYKTGKADTSYVQNYFLLFHDQASQVPNLKFLFPLTPVRLKDHSLLSSNDPQVISRDLTSFYQAPHCQSKAPFHGEEMDR